MSFQERPYQTEAVSSILDHFEKGDRSTLLILPTGCGKTVVATKVASEIWERFGQRTLFLAHREELINQAAATFTRGGLDTAIEMADQKAQVRSWFLDQPKVVVGTVQTLQRKRLSSWERDHFGLVITDEAHHARAATYANIYNHFEARHLGITATPDRGDGKNLGSVYESIAYEYPLKRAIKESWLVPIVTARLHTEVDLRGIRTTGGDYNQGDLEMIIGPAVESLARAAQIEMGSRRAVAFLPDVGSAEAFASALNALGVTSEAVSGKMPREERRHHLKAFDQGNIQVLTCCDLLTEGWDQPAVECVIICRPTKKRNRYAQMVGRGTRPCPDTGKVDCLVIDFDWQTENSSKDLVSTVELFDDSETDDEVVEEAERLMAEGKERDPMKALEQAELIVKNKFKIRLTGAKAVYRKFVYDPVGVGALIGMPVKKGWDFNANNPASEKQLNFLKSLGLKEPQGLSKQGAGKCIDYLMKRRQQGLATPGQVQFAINLGADPGQARTMTFDQAKKFLDEHAPKRKGA